MNRSNYGFEYDDNSINIDVDVDNKIITTTEKVLLGCSLLSLVLVFFMQKYVIIANIILSTLVIILGVMQGIKKAHKIWASIIILAITTLIIEIAWLTFFSILL